MTRTLSQLPIERSWLAGSSTEEALALVSARYQHALELKAELDALKMARKAEENPLKLDLSVNEAAGEAQSSRCNGMLMTCTTEKGEFSRFRLRPRTWLVLGSGHFYEALIGGALSIF